MTTASLPSREIVNVIIGNATLYLGDCLEVLKTLPDASVEAMVTDPPAGIGFMNRAWDHHKGGRAPWVAWMTEIARECLRVLKPGGHALVWAIPRTSHWTATAWEDAGFEIRDRIAHAFGSGFPKSADVSKMIDKAAGAEREQLPGKRHERYNTANGTTFGGNEPLAAHWNTITAPATEAAKQWAGYGTALKPAIEDWWLCRKPLDGTVAQNVLRHGCGGLNIDGCRVPTNDFLGGGMVSKGRPKVSEGWDRPWMHDPEVTAKKKVESTQKVKLAEALGRFPAHLIHDDSDEVAVCFPSTAPSPTKPITGVQKRRQDTGSPGKGELRDKPGVGYGDQGTAARYFYAVPHDPADLEEARRLVYVPKASKRDRDEGLDHFPEVRCGIMEDDAYQWKHDGYGNEYQRDTRRRNIHPTCKSAPLMRYLCRLITPPGGTVLDPFMGSGSTGKGALLEGFRFIGIERDPEYFDIACARIRHAQRQPDLLNTAAA